ncbi:MAG: adenine deaminase [Zetaproteobacteria bacterium CG1_02_53_45]|nr:MAG: adenine deaminase [Zetaproteobacteria bacterium CG1_02_53_45]
MAEFEICGQLVDVVAGEIYPARVRVADGRIAAVERVADSDVAGKGYIVPGLVDAHIHIESSMLVPTEFARLAVRHGTVATVSDPHEIANVAGIEGVRYMIDNAAASPMKFHFTAPSCVPATPFETAGAELDVAAVTELLSDDTIVGLSEMMNVPGVLNHDAGVMAKLAAAKQLNKPVDGHAPGLRGDAIRHYVGAGIATDHECFGLDEAREKAGLGMQVLIREGSAARNFEALWPLLNEYPELCMFCSDDKHPDDLLHGHIDGMVRRAIAEGVAPMAALRAASLNPVRFYKLPVGLLQSGDAADFMLVDDLERFTVERCWIDGACVAEAGRSLVESCESGVINRFELGPVAAADFRLSLQPGRLRVIDVCDGQLTTSQSLHAPLVADGNVVSDVSADVLKIAVINRYGGGTPALGFVRNFGLQSGAIASSVAHDSHNVIVVGCSDEAMAQAVNLLVEQGGGVSAVSKHGERLLALPVGGIMSGDDAFLVADAYAGLDHMVREVLGSTLRAPYMTLSFMALLVIPDIKLSDKGLFDGCRFRFVNLFKEDADV